MGLDIVEYFMVVEDAFEISIPDEHAVLLETPAKLIDYLCDRLGEAADGPPLVQTVFYRLRAAIGAELGVARSQVRPGCTLADLTERAERDVWTSVALRLGVDAKQLTHAPVFGWLAQLKKTPPRSIGDVAEQLAMLRPAALTSTGRGWTRAQVTEVVLRLLKQETTIHVQPADAELSFVRDLGMG